MEGTPDGYSVLIVDDNKSTRQSIASFLGARGITCLAAEDGERALAAIEAHHPDVVLLDIMMPGLNGIEVATRIAKLDPQPKVILMSGYADAMSEATKAKLNVYRTIWKPVPLKQLGQFLEMAIAHDGGKARAAG
ncbi:MAG: response regulator [Kiloniellales bacterium]